ncbi:MAG: formate--tetrahydrofolate ligase [Bdellovibrionales bacterium GWB1_55_8]|nr:MAG: formate--tetrahydrofolate ligase [Bdellovibrionales bacterium GWB1_55_8]
MSTTAFPSSLEIAQKSKPAPITEIASRIGISTDFLEPYGKYKAKVRLELLETLKSRPNGKYIDVTAITPTPLGEGKTTVTIGLTQGLGRLGKKSICCIRQPSQGPTFGIKGGAAGGGYSQVIPMEEFNLHLTGDMHAITAAHNLVAAALDARIYHENRMNDADWAKVALPRLDIDPSSITWNRVLDTADRLLRDIQLGATGHSGNHSRMTAFEITPASELMAILALATSLKDLRKRIGRAIVGLSRSGKPITLEDLGVAGAATVLMKDAIMPNLMQTIEGQPAFVHAGPFANIAHGQSSILADQMAIKLGEYVVTESGFAADIGFEKFCNIKCRYSGLKPDCAVLVVATRSLKMHGGGPKVVPGKPLDPSYTTENLELIRTGGPILAKHIQIVKSFGVPVVVAINRFHGDTDAEMELVRQIALQAGAEDAIPSTHFMDGGKGAETLAKAVMKACDKPNDFRFLYDLDMPIKKKLETIATKIYGAAGVEFSETAEKQIATYEKLGFNKIPVCMAKTHLSISHDPTKKLVPTGYIFPIREVRASLGAGFLYALAGEMTTMPGLGSRPNFLKIDLDENGQIVGLG